MISIRTRLHNTALGLGLSVALIPSIWSANLAAANLSGADIIDYESYPVTTLENVTPKVMLTMSNDHQYFSRAFNDFTDLDDDGDVDITYKNSFDYYGYFDPDKCYDYENKNYSGDTLGAYDVFVPKAFAVNHYCDTVSGGWSGNFLNWVSMTRMDIVRKILHGGLRATDTGTDTVLERAHLPTDTHSWAKYYNGADLAKLTPFSSQRTDTTNGGDSDGFDDANEGITICNTTLPSDTSQSHQISSATNPPVMRVASGNWRMWAAGEVFECHWKRYSAGTSSSVERGRENGNDVSFTQIDAGSNSPIKGTDSLSYSGNGPDFSVFVEVCVTGLINAGLNKENCREYPDGNFKPAGLLQEYGESEAIHFGLLTGSYQKNISGGVLRKNIGPIADEINTATDGSFITSQYSNTPTIGIIRTLDKLRIFGYRYGGGTGAARYFQSGSSDNCGFQGNSISEDDCNSWGNPISEIYAETIRYFAGLSATPAFAATDDNRVDGLDEANWVDPLDSTNFCASLNTVVFNASLTSYDEGSDVFTDISGASSPATLTDAVGDAEGFSGRTFFVGRTGPKTSPVNATNDEFCTGKVVTNLGNVAGLCPEGPTLDGTYHIAGMAHYAHTNDLRPSTLESDQKVTTYAVQLATNVPKFEIDTDPATDSGTDGILDNDADVTILPAYRLVKNDGGGTLVDFKIVQKNIEVGFGGVNIAYPTTNVLVDPAKAFIGTGGDLTVTPGSGIFYGKAMVQWEDSEQGGDYDMDQWGVISYIFDSNTQKVSVITDMVFYKSNNGQLFGFIISGTTEDGFHAYSGGGGSASDVFGAYQVGYEDPYPTVPDCFDNPNRVNGLCYFLNSGTNDPPRSHTFTVGAGGAASLPDPLLLAAKYGAFEDSNGNDIPDLESEFDMRDKDGNIVAGGDLDNIPDTYFFVTNPSALEQSLRAVFNQIIERVASGTAAAVVASEQEGTGAVFQALYDPVKSDALGNEAEWIGTLHAIFVDPKGFLREDGDDDDRLDGYDVDKVIEIFYDEDERRARLRRFTSSSATEFIQTGSSVSELITLNTIWNAREQLSAVTNVTAQRTYTDLANTGRHILTWIDDDLDGISPIDQSEIQAFTTATFTDSNFGWIDTWDGVTLDDDEADKLVNYIRGEEQTGYRPRVVDYDGDGTAEIMRLGDIVNSTPTVSAAPAEAFDILSLDQSYGEFRQLYRNRRNVIYVGANDGMIHAFNGGFFDVTTSEFKTALTSEVAHPLGSELWAYIPKNLLGHLQWLKDQGYGHVFYNDLKPFIFDAKIFDSSDSDYPGGWGTVMVIGMRLGGGHDNNGILLDTDHDGIGPSNADSDSGDDVLTKSAYVVIDITNPEEAPRIIAELSPPDQFFTTGVPAVGLIGAPDPTTAPSPPNKWVLFFGSGPTNLGDVDSAQSGRVFAYDLRELVLGNDGVIESGPFDNGNATDGIGFADTGDTNTFVGEITVADQDLDMKAEAIYFGTVGGESGVGGNLFRMSLNEDASPTNWDPMFKLLDVDQPFSSRPSITIDSQFRTWILAGTGRLFTNDDKASTATQTLYGFIDQYSIVGNAAPFDDPSMPIAMIDADFKDVTNAVTYADGSVDLDGDGDFDTTFDAYEDLVSTAGGWKLDYDFDTSAVLPAERTVSNQTLIAGILLSTAFTPSTELCGAEGESRIIGRAFNSGLVPPDGIFGQVCNGCPDGNAQAVGSISLGKGLASSPSIHIGNQDVPGKITVIVQQSTGAITGNQAQTLGGLSNGEVSWQEFRTD